VSVLGNPAVPVTKKVSVTKALLQQAGSLAAPVAKLWCCSRSATA
jgi:hypothetical protein